MTNLSAKVQEWMQLAPDLVSQFRIVPQVNHEPPETFEGLTWFVVVCNPKSERRAQLGLRRAGYQTYLPQTKRWVVHARKKEARDNPLFPRYLFIGIRSDQDFWKVQGVHGVEGIVRNDNRPVQIPAFSLTHLLQREASGEFDFTNLPETSPEYRPGDMVRLRKGVLAGFVAEVSSMLAKGRVEVFVNFMGNPRRASLHGGELERI